MIFFVLLLFLVLVAQIAELFDKDVRTVNEHLVNVFDEGELDRAATIRKFRIVRLEGSRSVEREIDHYRLEAILAVGYRVAQADRFPGWKPGNEFKAKREAMLKK